jgi:hypothetical protein
VSDIAFLNIEAVVVLKRFESVTTEQEIVENANVVALLEKFFHDVASDITGTARDEYAHGVSIPVDE